jgi:iron complex transport system ATP-binding protein
MTPGLESITVLFASADIDDGDTLEPGDGLQALQAGLGTSGIRLHYQPNASAESLVQAIDAYKPTILHLLAHGECTEDGPRILLPNAAGRGERHTPEWFGKLLRTFVERKQLAMVVLSMCHGHDIAVLAGRCAPVLLASRGEPSPEDSQIFTRTFYRQLAKGTETIASCAEDAELALGNNGAVAPKSVPEVTSESTNLTLLQLVARLDGLRVARSAEAAQNEFERTSNPSALGPIVDHAAYARIESDDLLRELTKSDASSEQVRVKVARFVNRVREDAENGLSKARPRVELRVSNLTFRRRGSAFTTSCESTAIVGGSLWALVGRNGAGKSTFLRLIAGELRPTEGEIIVSVDGTEVRTASYADVFRPGLQSCISTAGLGWGEFALTLEEQLVLDLAHRGAGLPEIESELRRWTWRLGLTTVLKKSYLQMSDGMRMRAKLARAFVRNSPVVLLDEPLAPLDFAARREIVRVLHELAHDGSGRLVIMATNDLDPIYAAVDGVLLAQEGRVSAVSVGFTGEVWCARYRPADHDAWLEAFVGRDKWSVDFPIPGEITIRFKSGVNADMLFRAVVEFDLTPVTLQAVPAQLVTREAPGPEYE